MRTPSRGAWRGMNLLLTLPLTALLTLLWLESLPLPAQEQPAETEPTAEGAIWDQIQAWYDEAKEAGEKVPTDIYSWIQQDLQRSGDWEYDVRRITAETDAALVEQLNGLGAERWEVIWVEPRARETRVFLKRPTRSYLRNIPLPDLLKLIPLGPGESN